MQSADKAILPLWIIDLRGEGVGMNWFVSALGVLFLIAGLSSVAFAQDTNADEFVQDPNDPNVIYKKKTEYDFEDDVVEGSFVRPEGEYLDARRAGRYASLIKIRENFVPEMLKSAEDI